MRVGARPLAREKFLGDTVERESTGVVDVLVRKAELLPHRNVAMGTVIKSTKTTMSLFGSLGRNSSRSSLALSAGDRQPRFPRMEHSASTKQRSLSL